MWIKWVPERDDDVAGLPLPQERPLLADAVQELLLLQGQSRGKWFYFLFFNGKKLANFLSKYCS
jgi:hypothetical protein